MAVHFQPAEHCRTSLARRLARRSASPRSRRLLTAARSHVPLRDFQCTRWHSQFVEHATVEHAAVGLHGVCVFYLEDLSHCCDELSYSRLLLCRSSAAYDRNPSAERVTARPSPPSPQTAAPAARRLVALALLTPPLARSCTASSWRGPPEERGKRPAANGVNSEQSRRQQRRQQQQQRRHQRHQRPLWRQRHSHEGGLGRDRDQRKS